MSVFISCWPENHILLVGLNCKMVQRFTNLLYVYLFIKFSRINFLVSASSRSVIGGRSMSTWGGVAQSWSIATTMEWYDLQMHKQAGSSKVIFLYSRFFFYIEPFSFIFRTSSTWRLHRFKPREQETHCMPVSCTAGNSTERKSNLWVHIAALTDAIGRGGVLIAPSDDRDWSQSCF